MIFPDWNNWTPEKASLELKKELKEAEIAVSNIEQTNPVRYEDLIWKLDDATRNLWHAWGKVSHMISVMNNDSWRKVEEEFQPEIITFSLRVGQSKKLYDSACECLKNLEKSDDVNTTYKRILEKTIQSAKHSGVALNEEKKKRFNEIQAELGRLTMDFSNAVIDATKAFTFEKDGKTYTIDDANYPETMKHCADREVREVLYRARVTRAKENTSRIKEILKLRSECADILGFKNYAELSLDTKCAPSVNAVMEMIDELDVATKKASIEEANELGSDCKPWDVAYLAERLREKKYAYSEEELKKYFEFDDVLNGLFRIAKFLFSVDITELADDNKPSVWHPQVRVFSVCENGEKIAYFYLDPYVRNGLKHGGAWMNEFCNRSDRRNDKPLAFIALNILPPDENGKTFMPFREVETLFHEFGHACQHMLTRIGEEDAAGINLVEWDAVEVASQFMENWCMDERTGIFVPNELKEKVKKAKNFRAASQCRRQLSFAKIDMLLHTKESINADDLKVEIFKHFGLPFIEGDLFLNAFTHIFAGGYAAGYYGYKWAEVMSADCFGAFEEVGLEKDEEIKALGKKYRETILALGGSVSAYRVFEMFRDRPPTIEALLRQQGLIK